LLLYSRDLVASVIFDDHIKSILPPVAEFVALVLRNVRGALSVSVWKFRYCAESAQKWSGARLTPALFVTVPGIIRTVVRHAEKRVRVQLGDAASPGDGLVCAIVGLFADVSLDRASLSVNDSLNV